MCPPLPVVGRYKMANEEEEATTEADEEEEDTNCVAPKSLKVRTPFQACTSREHFSAIFLMLVWLLSSFPSVMSSPGFAYCLIIIGGKN